MFLAVWRQEQAVVIVLAGPVDTAREYHILQSSTDSIIGLGWLYLTIPNT